MDLLSFDEVYERLKVIDDKHCLLKVLDLKSVKFYFIQSSL